MQVELLGPDAYGHASFRVHLRLQVVGRERDSECTEDRGVGVDAASTFLEELGFPRTR